MTEGMLLRRTGLVATLFVGLGLLGVSLHGMKDVDKTLQIAAATPAPAPQFVDDHHGRCDRERERRHRDRV